MMRKITEVLLLFIAGTITLAACKKNNTNGSQTPAGTAAPVGQPVGSAVSKTIDARGGVLSTADSAIVITIPSGAVQSPSTFSIQPVTSTLPNGIGLTYRLLPEGTHFNIPVSISFRYSRPALNGTLSQLLFVAYQDNKNVWQALASPVVDTLKRTITQQSTHFSDWGFFTKLFLHASTDHIGLGQTVTVTLTEVSDLTDLNIGGEVPVGTVTTAVPAADWQLAGSGTLSDKTGTSVTYTAPTTYPEIDPIAVSATFENVLNNQGANGKVVLPVDIMLDYSVMDGVFNGTTFHFAGDIFVRCAYVKNHLNLIGSNLSSMTLLFNIFPPFGAGSYPWSFVDEPHSFCMADDCYFGGTPYGYFFYLYQDPTKGQIGYTQGALNITHFGNAGSYLQGSFSGTVVKEQDITTHTANPPQYPLSFNFVTRIDSAVVQ